MNLPRIFLGSSGKQAKLLQAITRGLGDVADVEPWTTTFNPGRSTLDRLVELSQDVDFAAFVFSQDDWTSTDATESGQASPRDNVVFEAGLFGGALGMRRTFILHAHGSKLPSDLLGLTSVRYDATTSPAEVRAINQKLRKAIESEGRRAPVEGLWWQLSLTMRSEEEPSAVSLLRILRDRDGSLRVNGRSWQEDGTLSARYWSEAASERTDPAGILYFWRGERPRNPNAPQLEGTGEITLEATDRATRVWTTRSDRDPGLNAPVVGVDALLGDLGGHLLGLPQGSVLGEQRVGADESRGGDRPDEQGQEDLAQTATDTTAHDHEPRENKRPGQQQALQPERVDDHVVVGVGDLLSRADQDLQQGKPEGQLDRPPRQADQQPDQGEQPGQGEGQGLRFEGDDGAAVGVQLVAVDRHPLGRGDVQRREQVSGLAVAAG